MTYRYLVYRWIAQWADLLDAIVGIITFGTYSFNFGMSVRCHEARKRLGGKND